jgi:hypothetical protein
MWASGGSRGAFGQHPAGRCDRVGAATRGAIDLWVHGRGGPANHGGGSLVPAIDDGNPARCRDETEHAPEWPTKCHRLHRWCKIVQGVPHVPGVSCAPSVLVSPECRCGQGSQGRTRAGVGPRATNLETSLRLLCRRDGRRPESGHGARGHDEPARIDRPPAGTRSSTRCSRQRQTNHRAFRGGTMHRPGAGRAWAERQPARSFGAQAAYF